MVKKTWVWTIRLARPGRDAAADGDEQQPELADADQDAIEGEAGQRDRRALEQEHAGHRGKGEAQRGEQQRRQVTQCQADDDEIGPPYRHDGEREQRVARAERRHPSRRSASRWNAAAAPAMATAMTSASACGVPSSNAPAMAAASAPAPNDAEPISDDVAPARDGSTASAPAVVFAATKP